MHYEKFADGTIKYIEDEIPFEIPESWAWCRLGNISDNIQYGLSNSAEKVGTCRFLRITDIQNGGVDWDTVPFTNTNELDKYLLHINDILFARTGGTVGKSFLVSHLPFDSVFASYLIRVQLTNDISAQYIYWFFNSPTYWEQITCKTVGTGQPNCNGASLRNLLIPLPPLDEQYRILNKLAEIRPLIEDYSVTYNRIQDVHKGFPDKIKQSVLQWAVQGKLVQQDENDEPASVLLERIRAEKEELIKQGKLKKDKHESIIFRRDNSYYERLDDVERCIDDEIPFEIPNHWHWERMGNISFITKLAGFEYTKYISPAITAKGIPLLKGKNVKNSIFVENFESYIPESISDFLNRSQLAKKCILTPYVGSIGNVAIFHGNYKAHLGSNIGKIELYTTDLLEEYVVRYLHSNTGYEQLIKHKKATAQDSISMAALRDVLIPLPPTFEQERIIDKINNILSLVKKQ